MGVIGDIHHEKCIAAIDRVAAACRNNGKHWGAVTPTPAYASMLVEKGCTLLTPTNDVKLVAAGASAVRAAVRRPLEPLKSVQAGQPPAPRGRWRR